MTAEPPILERVRRASGAVALVIALAALSGWMLGLDPLTRIVVGWATLKANTAVAIGALGLSLWMPAGWVRRALALFAAGVAASALAEWVTGADLGVDEWLVVDAASRAAGQPPGRMAAATAIGLLLVSAAVLAARRAPALAQAAAALALGIGWVALVGYATELGPLWSVWLYGTVSAPTAIALVLLGIGGFLVEPGVGLAPALTGADAGAVLMRRLGPAAMVLPAASGLAAGRLVDRLGLQAGFGLAMAVTLDASVFLGLLSIVAGATRREERARVAAEAEVRHNAQRLAELSRALIEAHEVERRHLARELHDELGQSLTGLAMLVERAPHDPSAASLARSHLRELTATVRSMALELRPSMLDDLGLWPALVWLAERYPGLRVELAAQGEPRRYPAAVETAGYRIAQEALTNVVRHARTDRAELRVEFGDDSVVVEIADEGMGFGPERGDPSVGLSGMRERAASLGGRVEVASRPGRTLVRAILPASSAHR